MTKYKDTRNIDGLTTAERSLVNARELANLEARLEQLASIVEPTNILFGDGSLPNTQATRAEDIVSEEDVRLQQQRESDIANQFAKDSAQDGEIATNTTNIATNTTDIANLTGRASANENDISNNQVNIATNTTNIANNSTQIDINTGKNSQQDTRLDEVELKLTGAIDYLSKYSADGTVDATPTRIELDIDTDYTDKTAIENIKPTETTSNGWIIKKAQKFNFAFNLIAEQVSGTLPTQTVELIDESTNNVLASTKIKYDFTGATTIQSGYQRLSVIFDSTTYTFPRNVYIRSNVDAGSISINESEGLQESSVQRDSITTVKDTDVQSTASLGNANTQQDINQLKTEINSLAGLIESIKLPIGGIVISTTAPSYGTWKDLGVLAAGQSIIGSRPDGDGNNTVADGTSYSGAVKSHNHIWSTGYGFGDGGGTARKFINHLTTYNSDDTETSITDSSEDTAKNVYTKKTGGSNNIAYGKQIGYDIHVWKRTA